MRTCALDLRSSSPAKSIPCAPRWRPPASDALAEKSGELIVKYIYESFENKDNFLAKEKMLIASNLAGIAFNIAGLGANHSIAHQIGGIHHIPHGLANAILLKEVIDANAKDEKVKVKYAQFSRKISLSKKDDTDDVAIEILKKYRRQIGRASCRERV